MHFLFFISPIGRLMIVRDMYKYIRIIHVNVDYTRNDDRHGDHSIQPSMRVRRRHKGYSWPLHPGNY